MLADADRIRVIAADQIDVAAGGNLFFQTHGPVTGVYEETSKSFAFEVAAVSHSGGEDTSGFSAGAGISFRPGDGNEVLFGIGFVVGIHSEQDLSHDERFTVAAEGGNSIDVRWSPDVFCAFYDGVVLHTFCNESPGAFLLVCSVVADPGFSEDLSAVAAVELFVFEAVFCVWAVGVLFVSECVRGCSHADDGPAGVGVINDEFHLVIGELAKAGEKDHEVGFLEGFETGDVIDSLGVNLSGFLVDGKKDGAFEAVVDGENLGELRHGIFRAIFLIAGDEDDVLSFAGAIFAL